MQMVAGAIKTRCAQTVDRSVSAIIHIVPALANGEFNHKYIGALALCSSSPVQNHRNEVEVLGNSRTNCLSAASFCEAPKHLRSEGNPLKAGGDEGALLGQPFRRVKGWASAGDATPVRKE